MSPKSPELRQLATWLAIVTQLYTTRMNTLLSKHDFTTTQFGLLNHLARHPQPHTISAIANAVEVNQPGVTKIVKKFERMGLVQVTRDSADSRKRLVAITEAGGAAIMRVQQDIAPDVASWFIDWDEAERQAFLQQLQKLGIWLDGARLD